MNAPTERHSGPGPGPWRATATFWGVVFVLAMLPLTLERVALWAFLRPPVEHGGTGTELLGALGRGLRFDASGLAYPFATALIVAAIAYSMRRRPRPEPVLAMLLLGVTSLSVVADWHFYAEFRTRLNFVAVEYLDDPRTLLDVVTGRLGWPAFVASVGLVAFVAFVVLRAARVLERRWLEPCRPALRWFHLLPLLMVLAVLARGGFARKPLVPQDADGSAHRFGNELTLSGLFTLERHLYEAFSDPASGRAYGTAGDEALVTARKLVDDGARFTDALHPMLRTTSGGPARARNVVLVILESFAARWVGTLSAPPGQGLTPAFDRLATEGLLFERFYTNGPSTNRSLPALLGGLPCLPGRLSLTKSADGRQPFLTLGSVLATTRSETAFVTGGSASWENLGGWCASQGFAHIVDREDFEEEECVSAFGPPDHVLLDRALAVGDELSAGAHPFGLVALTATNHPPFALPDPLPPEAAAAVGTSLDPRERALRYADWSLGRFIDAARQRPWGKDTLFVLVGDHGLNGSPVTDIDLERRHVPLLLLGSGIEPGRSDRLGSHVDVLPTILEHLGRPARHAAWGHSLLRAVAGPRFVVLGPHGGVRLHGVLVDEEDTYLLVDRPGRPGELFRVGEDRVTLTPTVVPEVTERWRRLGRSYLGCFHDALRRRAAGPAGGYTRER